MHMCVQRHLVLRGHNARIWSRDKNNRVHATRATRMPTPIHRPPTYAIQCPTAVHTKELDAMQSGSVHTPMHGSHSHALDPWHACMGVAACMTVYHMHGGSLACTEMQQEPSPPTCLSRVCLAATHAASSPCAVEAHVRWKPMCGGSPCAVEVCPVDGSHFSPFSGTELARPPQE